MPGNKPNNKYLFHKFEAANNREGSQATQASRSSHLHIVARELSEMGYRHLSPRNLKRKHVDALVNHWLQTKLAIVTIKSRMSTVRWLGPEDRQAQRCAKDERRTRHTGPVERRQSLESLHADAGDAGAGAQSLRAHQPWSLKRNSACGAKKRPK